MAELQTPAFWPSHIIRAVHSYVIGAGAQNHIRSCLLPQEETASERTPSPAPCPCCFCTSSHAQVAPLLCVCRTWTHTACSLLARHMCVDLGRGADGVRSMHSMSGACLVQRYCSIAAIAGRRLHRAVQSVAVRIPLESIRNGDFVDQWNSNKGSDLSEPFPAVRTLRLCVYWPRDITDNGFTTPVDDEHVYHMDAAAMGLPNSKMVHRAAMHLASAFPNVHHVELQNGKVQSLVGAAMVGALYQALVDQGCGKQTVEYSAWNRLIQVDRLPVVQGLTSLRINQIVHGAEVPIQLAVRNAQTLIKMDITLGMSFLCSNLVVDAAQMPIQYPRLHWLQLAVFGGVPFAHRHICAAHTFPALRHLRLPGVYPFSNAAILDDCANTLESLCLGVSHHMYHPYTELFGLLSTKYVRLKRVELHALPAEDPFLLPGIVTNESTEPFPDAYYAMAFALGNHVSHVKLAFGAHCQNIQKSFLFDALVAYSTNLAYISVLDLKDGCGDLDLSDIARLARQLPALIHLLELTLTTASQTADNIGRYFSHLSLALPALQRVNVYSTFALDQRPLASLPMAVRFTESASEKTATMYQPKFTGATIYTVDSATKDIDVSDQLNGLSMASVGKLMPADMCRLVILHVPVIRGLLHKSVYAIVVWAPKGCAREEEVLYKAAMDDFCAQIPRYHCIFELSEWETFGKKAVISKMSEISGDAKGKWK
ncbi:hypothetical protein GGI22_001084 [Coemansia erecta]|nr:hypothetical protein GGI22_001084 [Coemansia erecta]